MYIYPISVMIFLCGILNKHPLSNNHTPPPGQKRTVDTDSLSANRVWPARGLWSMLPKNIWNPGASETLAISCILK